MTACISQNVANQFKETLRKEAGAYFIPELEYSIGMYVSMRTISGQSQVLYKNIKNGLTKQPLVFCDIGTKSQQRGDGHAVCLSCIRCEDNSVVLEFFDSNGLLLPYKAKADMYFMSLIQNVIHLFKTNDNIECTLVEMNTKDLNPTGHCNSWIMFYFYTRLAYQSLSTKDFFSFVYSWQSDMIKKINKFLQKKIGKNSFNIEIQKMQQIATNKSAMYNNVVKLNKTYSTVDYTTYTQKNLPKGVKNKLLKINPNQIL